MAYELTGKVKQIGEEQTFGESFTKREFVVTVDDGKYPQDIALECVQDRVSLLDAVSPEDEVSVSFDIRGKEYKGRYFNNLIAWKIQVAARPNAADVSPPEGAASADDDSGIPF